MSITYPIAKLRSFPSLPFEEKKQIISSGRPTPDLSNLTQESGRNRSTRSFNNDWYQKKSGCVDAQKILNYFVFRAYFLKETLHLCGLQQDFPISRI